MIIIRAPMRISFAGGGTDMASFYRRYPGRVVSTTIDKYVYVTLNRPPLIRKVSARYSTNETVDHPSELKNDRFREALLDFGFYDSIELATFTDVSVNAGLGASSSFSVALQTKSIVSSIVFSFSPGRPMTSWIIVKTPSSVHLLIA